MGCLFARVALLVILGTLPLLEAPAKAADPGLRVDVQPLALRSRTDGPAFIDIKLSTRQQVILEGVLELHIMTGNEKIYSVRTPELAIAPGGVSQRLLLPPANARTAAYRGLSLEAQIRFVTKKGTHDLGRFPIANEGSAYREYVIGVCAGGSKSSPHQPKLWQALRPDLRNENPGTVGRLLESVPAPFPPEDLPSATGLCAFDVVAVEGASFAALGEKQLGALATWVEAGGSLCVVPTAPLGPEHLTFLNTLAGGGQEAVTFVPGGPLTIHGGAMLLRRPGIGRLVIARSAPANDAELEEPEWVRAAAFLAKTPAGPRRMPPPAYKPQNYQEEKLDYARNIQAALFQQLPRDSRMIPLPVIGLILGAFVLAVGPGEWLLLGLIRRRRWTWITFPVLAVGFTMLGIRTAEFYLGLNDKSAKLIVTDVGRDGGVVRENQFELRIAGRDKTARLELHQIWGAVREPAAARSTSAPSIPLYEGQIPGHYTMSLPLRQWKPVLFRTLTLGAGTAPPDFHWPEGTPPPAGDAMKMRRYLGDVFRNPGWTTKIFNKTTTHGTTRFPHGALLEQLLNDVSFLDRDDEQMTTATIAPSGRNDGMDLAIADLSNTAEWTVLAMKLTPGEIRIVRRLYYSNDSSDLPPR